MKLKSCKNCCFFDECRSHRVCSFYSPADNDIAEEELDVIIESECGRFRNEYWEYVSQYNDDIFFL